MKKLVLSLVATSLAISVYAQTPAAPAATTTAPAATPKPKPLSVGDQKFIKDLSEAILIEQKYLQAVVDNKSLTLGESSKRATDTANGDLKRIWTALATLATNKGTTVAQEVSKSDLAKVEKLSKEKPDKFEKEFFKDYGKETKKTAKLIEGSKSLQDPDVKKFAEDWTASIKGHDASAESAEKALSAKKK